MTASIHVALVAVLLTTLSAAEPQAGLVWTPPQALALPGDLRLEQVVGMGDEAVGLARSAAGTVLCRWSAHHDRWAPCVGDLTAMPSGPGARLVCGQGRLVVLAPTADDHGLAAASTAWAPGTAVAFTPLPGLTGSSGIRSAVAGPMLTVLRADQTLVRLALQTAPGQATSAWEPLAGPSDGSPALLALAGDVLLAFDPGLDRGWRHAATGWIRLPQPSGRVPAAPRLAVAYGPGHLAVLAGEGRDSLHLFHPITGTWLEAPLPVVDHPIIGLSAQAQSASLSKEVSRYTISVHAASTTGAAWVATGHHPGTQGRLGCLDYGLIAAYFLAVLAIGAWYARRERSSEDFFLGGRRIPWWAAGISIYATGVSAISYMAIPAQTYSTDWLYIGEPIACLIAWLLLGMVFVGPLRRLRITTIYEYLELRFNAVVRMIGVLQFLAALLLTRMSVIMLLPSIALSAVTGWDIYFCILLMGLFSTLYTMFGGIQAVIWTDIIQCAVMFGGALLALVLIISSVEGGAGTVLATAQEAGRMRAVDASFDLGRSTVWVFGLYIVVALASRMGDQLTLQRCFACPDARAARRSVIACALLTIPGTLVFYLVGTALFGFYAHHPQDLDPNLRTDAIFPLFIAQHLPTGVAGLVIAGLFAATMSTLDSGMNSAATVAITDGCRLLGRHPEDRTRLLIGKIVSGAIGILATAIACLLVTYEKGKLWDFSIRFAGLVGGGFAGVMILAMLTRRANSIGVLTGIVAGLLNTLALEIFFKGKVSPFIYGALSTLVCIVIGYLVSLAVRTRPRDLTGMTLWTPLPAAPPAAVPE